MNEVFSLALDAISGMLILLGAFFTIVGAIGVVRMPDVFTRMHAASVIETAGLGSLLIGLVMQSETNLLALKLAFILVLVLITAPVAAHAIARGALFFGIKPVPGENWRGDNSVPSSTLHQESLKVGQARSD